MLRGSRLERRLARTLEGESGMNDPVALLLVVGFGEWIADPSYGAGDMALSFVVKLGLGAGFGLAVGWIARRAISRAELPTQGLYPVATLATAALAYGVAEVAGGSGFLAVYVAALVLGTGSLPARSTVVSFHQGLGWLVQIGLFFLLGLLVFPGDLLDVAGKGLLLSLLLIFVARPLGDAARHPVRRACACPSGRCSAGPACAARSRSGWRPSRSSPGSPSRS